LFNSKHIFGLQPNITISIIIWIKYGTKKNSIHVSKVLDQNFCMCNPHFLLDKPNKPIFHKNLDVFLFIYLYTHIGNTLFVDNMPYKNMFNDSYSAIFLESFDSLHGKDQYLLRFVLLTWKIFIHSNTMFPPLLNTIPLVGLDVLIDIIQQLWKCYLWNVVGPTNPIFVTIWNWNKKYLINCSSKFCLFEYLKTFLLIKFIENI